MTDLTAIRVETVGTVAGAFALAVWALRDPDVVKVPSSAATVMDLRFRLMPREGAPMIVNVGRDAIVGRSIASDLIVDEPTVSKRHARIGYDERPWIEDLESTNGTFVNGRRVAGSVALRRGDRIALGSAKIVFLGLVPRVSGGAKG